MRNLQLTFDCMYCGQKLGEDFAKFCGLLKIYELYKRSKFHRTTVQRNIESIGIRILGRRALNNYVDQILVVVI